MKKTKFRRLAAMAASLLCCLIFTVPAYAQSSEPQPETAPSPAETEAEPETQNPFTPDGTGTVVDNATDEDGKEFYTITTADESVFYLVIDKQKTSENVYFLNTVTTDDLLPLAEQQSCQHQPGSQSCKSTCTVIVFGHTNTDTDCKQDSHVINQGSTCFN